MEFPITELLDYESSVVWILDHFHLAGRKSRLENFDERNAVNWWCIVAESVR